MTHVLNLSLSSSTQNFLSLLMFCWLYETIYSRSESLPLLSVGYAYVVLLSQLFLSLGFMNDWFSDVSICRWLFTQMVYRCWCQETISLLSSLIQRLCLVLKTSHILSTAHQEIPPTRTPFKNVEDCLFLSRITTIGLFNIRVTNHIELSWVLHRMFLFSRLFFLYFLSPYDFATLIGFREIMYAYFVYIGIRIENLFMPLA